MYIYIERERDYNVKRYHKDMHQGLACMVSIKCIQNVPRTTPDYNYTRLISNWAHFYLGSFLIGF